ncbi:thiamine-phosphate pyrophosphorylase [Mariniflexile fucanivorans]|uniref:Thiamine-phosphate synthase n=1 Tax=Mariniflexile fucanivorans TaxID=264023 RepID=A0A4R1RIB0_9FLAO|nr:thiamine phosphate synthase [Mariniflexile fucanivorans]TCL65382.1 thiamine-phosphate pyrophosphorylase [Mariniflexile fucanivorans]
MIIPKLHYISQGISPNEHLENIQKACSSGAELVQLRLKNVSEKKYLKIATAAREITSHFQTRLIINDDYKTAKAVKADGVHLGKTDASPTIVRKHLYTWQIIGGTANTLQDCEVLIGEEVDYISLGPFRFTTTKENLPKFLGLDGYTAILEALNTETPIIAVGGIITNDVADILETGISGIAVSGEITRNFDSIRTFNLLLNASATEEQLYTFK